MIAQERFIWHPGDIEIEHKDVQASEDEARDERGRWTSGGSSIEDRAIAHFGTIPNFDATERRGTTFLTPSGKILDFGKAMGHHSIGNVMTKAETASSSNVRAATEAGLARVYYQNFGSSIQKQLGLEISRPMTDPQIRRVMDEARNAPWGGLKNFAIDVYSHVSHVERPVVGGHRGRETWQEITRPYSEGKNDPTISDVARMLREANQAAGAPVLASEDEARDERGRWTSGGGDNVVGERIIQSRQPSTAALHGTALIEAAKARYGVTDDPRRAVWIFPDGAMLDGSQGGDRRGLEHDRIAFDLTGKPYGSLLQEGWARFYTDSWRGRGLGGVMFSKPLTASQLSTVRSAAQQSDAFDIEHATFPGRNTTWSRHLEATDSASVGRALREANAEAGAPVLAGEPPLTMLFGGGVLGGLFGQRIRLWSEDQPRDPDGRFASGGGSETESAHVVAQGIAVPRLSGRWDVVEKGGRQFIRGETGTIEATPAGSFGVLDDKAKAADHLETLSLNSTMDCYRAEGEYRQQVSKVSGESLRILQAAPYGVHIGIVDPTYFHPIDDDYEASRIAKDILTKYGGPEATGAEVKVEITTELQGGVLGRASSSTEMGSSRDDQEALNHQHIYLDERMTGNSHALWHEMAHVISRLQTASPDMPRGYVGHGESFRQVYLRILAGEDPPMAAFLGARLGPGSALTMSETVLHAMGSVYAGDGTLLEQCFAQASALALSEDEPRDERGRWTDGGGEGGSDSAAATTYERNALRNYTTTNDLRKASFLLPNGRMITRDPPRAPAIQRGQEHADIARRITGRTTGEDGIHRLQEQGWVRCLVYQQPYSDKVSVALDAGKPLTDAQIRVVTRQAGEILGDSREPHFVISTWAGGQQTTNSSAPMDIARAIRAAQASQDQVAAAEVLRFWSEDQPRDADGRFGSGGGADAQAKEWTKAAARNGFTVDERVGHGWLTPDGRTIHAQEHYDLYTALDIDANDLYHEGFVRVADMVSGVAIEIGRPLTPRQLTALTDANPAWTSAYVSVRNTHFDEQVDGRRGWAALLRKAGATMLAEHDVSDEPRDEKGEWTAGGGGDAAKWEATKTAALGDVSELEQKDAFYVYYAEDEAETSSGWVGSFASPGLKMVVDGNPEPGHAVEGKNSGPLYATAAEAQAYTDSLVEKYGTPEMKVQVVDAGPASKVDFRGNTELNPDPHSYTLQVGHDFMDQQVVIHEFSHMLATEQSGYLGHGNSFRETYLRVLKGEMPKLARSLGPKLAKWPTTTLAERPLAVIARVDGPAGHVLCLRAPLQRVKLAEPRLRFGDAWETEERDDRGEWSSGGGAATAAPESSTPHFGSVTQAADYVRQRYGYGDFTGMTEEDLPTLQKCVEAVDRLTAKYPQVQARDLPTNGPSSPKWGFGGIGTFESPSCPRVVVELGGDAWAVTRNGGGYDDRPVQGPTIWLNPKGFRDFADNTLAICGFTFARTPEEAITHEMGHVVQDCTLTGGGRSTASDERSIYGRVYSGPRMSATRDVSIYAGQSDEERFAEMFTVKNVEGGRDRLRNDAARTRFDKYVRELNQSMAYNRARPVL